MHTQRSTHRASYVRRLQSILLISATAAGVVYSSRTAFALHLDPARIHHANGRCWRAIPGTALLHVGFVIELHVFSVLHCGSGIPDQCSQVIDVRASQPKRVDLGKLAVGWIGGYKLTQLVERRVDRVHPLSFSAVCRDPLLPPVMSLRRRRRPIVIAFAVALVRAGTGAGTGARAALIGLGSLLLRLAQPPAQLLF